MKQLLHFLHAMLSLQAIAASKLLLQQQEAERKLQQQEAAHKHQQVVLLVVAAISFVVLGAAPDSWMGKALTVIVSKLGK